MREPANPYLNSDPLPGPVSGTSQQAFNRLDSVIADELAPVRPFILSVFSVAPYLQRLCLSRPKTLLSVVTAGPQAVVAAAIAHAIEAGQTAGDTAALDTALRQAKADMHLATGLADLAGYWPVDQVTKAVTDFADAAVKAALLGHARLQADMGRLSPVTDLENPVPGLFVFALGKMGGGELNYSSDIDLVCFFDPAGVQLPDGQEPKVRLPRLIQAVAKSLQEVTADRYVFRTDLRLRPDPGATPVAMSAEAALNYYENIGQTWERAAWIKARYCAGDKTAADRYLTHMQPFIWRRALDYAAIDDIRGLARQIQTVGRRAKIDPAGHDLKLGRGGIREIEFFAQVPQLVMGGRQIEVRTRSTCAALSALAGQGAVSGDVAESLKDDYVLLREWEHRIQMRQDEASQTLPSCPKDRSCIARMAGFETLDAFDHQVEALLRRVHGHFSDQFADDDERASDAGSLVLTGVEPTPDTLATLDRLGFSQPSSVWKRLNGWAAGRMRAVRSTRARTLFARFAPRLVDLLASTGEADEALARFSAFFEQLPYGVQPLSLLMNEPELAADLIDILTMAPRMAQALARRPDLLDVMLDRRFSVPLSQDAPGAFDTRLRSAIATEGGYEAALNVTRRLVREERFRIGAQVLRGTADAQTAGAAYTTLADTIIAAMAAAAEDETVRRYGPMPGRYAVLGLGKLGGGELAADSDLDIMIVYDGDPAQSQTWFTRFSQRVVSALSVPTEEGELFEVDMQLRPSGKAGPVAVQLSRFETYYQGEAWTWELMALTRARVVGGDATLGDAVMTVVEAALAAGPEPETVRRDARDMRDRLEREKPARSDWDIKARPGGLQDIEFIAQSLQLQNAGQFDVVRGSTASALSALVRVNALPVEEARFMGESTALYLGLAQLIRSAHGSGFRPETASSGFAARLSAAGGAGTLKELQLALGERCERVRALLEKYLPKA